MAKATDWFGEFVREVALSWHRRFREARANPTDTRRVAKLKQMTADASEDDVRDRLEALGYEAHRTPGSHTPGDVWGFRDEGTYIHVALVQVKATYASPKPAQLLPAEREAVPELMTLVEEAFRSSTLVPTDVRAKPRIVSAAYVGILVRFDADDEVSSVEIASTALLKCNLPRGRASDRPTVERKLRKFYSW